MFEIWHSKESVVGDNDEEIEGRSTYKQTTGDGLVYELRG